METEKEYHSRRVLEIKSRINVLENYIESNSELKHDEKGVGGSYLKRRNSRNKANKEYRISEFKEEIERLKDDLKMHETTINYITQKT